MASRVVRRVPAGWQHPRDEKNRLIPLFDGRLLTNRLALWDDGKAAWDRGEVEASLWGWPTLGGSTDPADRWVPRPPDIQSSTYEEWSGERPDPADYTPDWPDAERTHLMLYEDTTEGTPMTPAFATAEELAGWCADNRVSCWADETLTYEQWLEVVRDGRFDVVLIGYP